MKIKKLFMSISSVITAFSLLTAANVYSPMEASAWDNQLNIKIYMDVSMCTSFNTETGNTHITRGTYGVPTSFNTRLPNVTAYTKSFYAYHNANINFYSFNPSYDILESPAYECANNSSSYLSTLKNGCSCVNGNDCFNENLHHNNVLTLKNDLPPYDPSKQATLYLTASKLCNNTSNHHNVYGIRWSGDNVIVMCDSDYRKSHVGENTSPYAYTRSTMVHEVGHLYNVQDHYDLTSTTVYNPNCTWGDNYDEYYIRNSCSICSICASIIRNNADMYQHT